VDDIHLADRHSLALLARIKKEASLASSSRLALIVSSTPDFHLMAAPLGLEFKLMKLAPLESDEVISIANQELGSALPPRAKILISNWAGGNPSYARHLVRFVIEKGGIQRINGNWQDSPVIEKLDFPYTFHHAVVFQYEQLGTKCQMLLKIARVVGQTFSGDLLKATLEGDFSADELRGALQGLVEKGIFTQLEPKGNFKFSQAIWSDVVAAKSLAGEQKQIYLKLATAVEAGAPAPAGDPIRFLANCYMGCELQEKIADWASRAAVHLQERGSSTDAAVYFRASIQARMSILSQSPMTANDAKVLLGELSVALPSLALAFHEESLTIADQVLTRVPEELVPIDRAEALRQKALIFLHANRISEAEQVLNMALQLVEKQDASELYAMLLATIGSAMEARGDLEAATQCLTKSFQVIGDGPVQNRDFYWEQLNRFGRIHARLQDRVTARKLFESARAHARQAGSISGEVKAIINLAGILSAEGQIQQALLLLDTALELTMRSGDHFDEARICYNQGRLFLGIHENDQARKRLERAVSISRELGWKEGIALATQALGLLKL
jgi:serine/threonine-protein kinase